MTTLTVRLSNEDIRALLDSIDHACYGEIISIETATTHYAGVILSEGTETMLSLVYGIMMESF